MMRIGIDLRSFSFGVSPCTSVSSVLSGREGGVIVAKGLATGGGATSGLLIGREGGREDREEWRPGSRSSAESGTTPAASDRTI